MNYVIERNSVSFFDDYYYKKPEPIPVADAGTFKAISTWFGADRHHVYFLHNVIVGADPASFIYLGGYNCQWARDKAVAYYFWPSKAARQWKVLKSQSLDSFKVLPSCRFSEYAGDVENIYYMGKQIRGADAQSFHIMVAEKIEDKSTVKAYSFSRDQGRVYFQGRPIEGINCNTFRVVHAAPGTRHTEYGTDGSNAFFDDHVRNKMGSLPYSELPASIQDYLSR